MKNSLLPVCILIGLLLSACATRSTLVPDSSKATVAAHANTQLGIAYIKEKKYELAMTKLKKAIDEEPDYALAHSVIAILYDKVGDQDAADTHYRTSLRLEPNNGETHNNFGQFLCSHEHYDEAEKEYLKAADNPYYETPQLALLNAGECMAAKHDKTAAEKYYRLSLNKDPKYSPALYRMAELEYDAGKYLKARAWLQRYGEVTKQTPESLWLGVRTEYALKDNQASNNYALQLKSRFPQSEQATMLQGWENERRSGN